MKKKLLCVSVLAMTSVLHAANKTAAAAAAATPGNAAPATLAKIERARGPLLLNAPAQKVAADVAQSEEYCAANSHDKAFHRSLLNIAVKEKHRIETDVYGETVCEYYQPTSPLFLPHEIDGKTLAADIAGKRIHAIQLEGEETSTGYVRTVATFRLGEFNPRFNVYASGYKPLRIYERERHTG